MEAELLAYYETSSQAIWLRNFITGLQIVDSIEKPLRIYCDNEAAVSFSRSNKSSTSCKHLDIKLYVIQEKTMEKRQVSFDYIGTQHMLADPLTKGLAPKLYSQHVKDMGLMSSSAVL
jgi:hypothetical protein